MAFPWDRPPKARPRRKGRRGSIFERVKAAHRVEELASRFTELERVGAGKYKALCPIHDEKTPSFRVDQERFGLGKNLVYESVRELRLRSVKLRGKVLIAADALDQLADRRTIDDDADSR